METKYDIKKCFIKTGYLLNICEEIYISKNYKENYEFSFKMPESMVFETSIWMVGENLRQYLIKQKRQDLSIIKNDIFSIIKNNKYKHGRESFVMFLSFYKNDSEVVELLGQLLDDNDLCRFALFSLYKLKCPKYKEKIKNLMNDKSKQLSVTDVKKYLALKEDDTSI